MKEIVQHPLYGEIIYNENAWTGKKVLTVNGVEVSAVSKNEYTINDKKAILKGSFLTGSTLQIDDETIQLSPKVKWYEVVFAMIPFLFLMIWGNSVSLCAIFPVVGGAIGGALGGLGAVLSLLFMKSKKARLAKILIGIIATAATILIAFLLAHAILSIA